MRRSLLAWMPPLLSRLSASLKALARPSFRFACGVVLFVAHLKKEVEERELRELEDESASESEEESEGEMLVICGWLMFF
jgi:hypothetical protein